MAALGMQMGASADMKVTRPSAPAQVGRVCEFGVGAPTDVANPFRPDAAALDAEITAPSGKRLSVPGFYIIPHRPVTTPPEKRIARRVRIFFSTHRIREGRQIEMLIDDVRLVDRDTGDEVVLDDFENAEPWQEQGASVWIDTVRSHSGRHALGVSLTVPKRRGWPGLGRDLGDADWQRFDEMRLWVCPLAPFRDEAPGIEFYTATGAKVQSRLDLVGRDVGKWHEIVWRFPKPQATIRFEPAGKPEWRVRFTPLETGPYRARITYRDGTGEQTAKHTFAVSPGDAHPFVRISPRDSRYLEFATGRPCLLVGTNLLGRELAYYRRYLDQLAKHGCNFIRIWLSPRTMGFELEPGKYAQDRAAQLDALFELCRERGIYVMACITDFREVCAFHSHGYWKRSPFNAAVGGPCAKPEDFFTSDEAREFYQRKLRYAVARWSAHPNLLAWEFFNEVNITDGWRKAPDSVRAWHAVMGPFVRKTDPHGHVITSSFAGIEDDALWEQPRMEIVQRHFYLRPGSNFVDTAVEAQAALVRHRKPALIGEFGRRKNEHAEKDSDGVSLHNGLWASVMSGGCGTAMTWWWQWVDQHGLWHHFASLSRFAEGIDWPTERFAPLKADVSAEPDAAIGFGAVRVSPKKGSFKPAPFNQPVTVTLREDDTADAPDLIARFLHGTKNHPDLHNPITFKANYPVAGTFTVVVDGVSQYGGAGLTISVDDEVRLNRDFPSDEREASTIRRYDGRHTVPVPAGRHSITVENPGKDWLVVAEYEFGGARSRPPLRLLGLRGRNTVVAWLWNETHIWYSPVLDVPRAPLRNAAATLRNMPPGTWRVRPFDPWTGKWGQSFQANVGSNGRLQLSMSRLTRDVAWRIEAR